jgi:hypothetical protein
VGKFLTKEEIEQCYPLMLKVFGEHAVQIERITELGKDRAHMIFAPIVEEALRRAAETKLWDAFVFTVKVKKRRRAARGGSAK